MFIIDSFSLILSSSLCIIIIISCCTTSSTITATSSSSTLLQSCNLVESKCYIPARNCILMSKCGQSSSKGSCSSSSSSSSASTNKSIPSFDTTILPCTVILLQCLQDVKNEILDSISSTTATVLSQQASLNNDCINWALMARKSLSAALDSRLPSAVTPIVCPFITQLLLATAGNNNTEGEILLSTTVKVAMSNNININNAIGEQLHAFLVENVSATCDFTGATATEKKSLLSKVLCQCPSLSLFQEKTSTSLIGETNKRPSKDVVRREFFSELAFRGNAVELARNTNCSIVSCSSLSRFFPKPTSCGNDFSTQGCSTSSSSSSPTAFSRWLNFISGSWVSSTPLVIKPVSSSSSLSSSSDLVQISSPSILQSLFSSSSSATINNTTLHPSIRKDDFTLTTSSANSPSSTSSSSSFTQIPASFLPLNLIGRLKWCTDLRNEPSKYLTFYKQQQQQQHSSKEASCLTAEPRTLACSCPTEILTSSNNNNNNGGESTSSDVEESRVRPFSINLVEATPSSSTDSNNNRTINLVTVTFCSPPTLKVMLLVESRVAKNALSEESIKKSLPEGSTIFLNTSVSSWSQTSSSSPTGRNSYSLFGARLLFIDVPSHMPALHTTSSALALSVILMSPLVNLPSFPLVTSALALASDCNAAFKEIGLLGLQSFVPGNLYDSEQTELESLQDASGQLGFVAIVFVVAPVVFHFLVSLIWAICSGVCCTGGHHSSVTHNNNTILERRKSQAYYHHTSTPAHNSNNNSSSRAVTTNHLQPDAGALAGNDNHNDNNNNNTEATGGGAHPEQLNKNIQNTPTTSVLKDSTNNLSRSSSKASCGNAVCAAFFVFISQLPWARTFRRTLFPQLSGAVLFWMLPFLTFLSLKGIVQYNNADDEFQKDNNNKTTSGFAGVIIVFICCLFLWLALVRAVYKNAKDNSFFYKCIRGMSAESTSEWRIEDCPDSLYIFYDDETLNYFDKNYSFLAGATLFVPQGSWLYDDELIRRVAKMPQGAGGNEPTLLVGEGAANSKADDDNNNKIRSSSSRTTRTVTIVVNNNNNGDEDEASSSDNTSVSNTTHHQNQSDLHHQDSTATNCSNNSSSNNQTESSSSTTATTTTAAARPKVMLSQSPSVNLPVPTKVQNRLDYNRAADSPFVKVSYYSRRKKSGRISMRKQPIFETIVTEEDGRETLMIVADDRRRSSNLFSSSQNINNNNMISDRHSSISVGDNNAFDTRSRSDIFANSDFRYAYGALLWSQLHLSLARMFRCVIQPFKLKYSFVGPLVITCLLFIISILTALQPTQLASCDAIFLVAIVLCIVCTALTLFFRPFRSIVANVLVSITALLSTFVFRAAMENGGDIGAAKPVFVTMIALNGFGVFIMFVINVVEEFVWSVDLVNRHLGGAVKPTEDENVLGNKDINTTTNSKDNKDDDSQIGDIRQMMKKHQNTTDSNNTRPKKKREFLIRVTNNKRFIPSTSHLNSDSSNIKNDNDDDDFVDHHHRRAISSHQTNNNDSPRKARKNGNNNINASSSSNNSCISLDDHEMIVATSSSARQISSGVSLGGGHGGSSSSNNNNIRMSPALLPHSPIVMKPSALDISHFSDEDDDNDNRDAMLEDEERRFEIHHNEENNELVVIEDDSAEDSSSTDSDRDNNNRNSDEEEGILNIVNNNNNNIISSKQSSLNRSSRSNSRKAATSSSQFYQLQNDHEEIPRITLFRESTDGIHNNNNMMMNSNNNGCCNVSGGIIVSGTSPTVSSRLQQRKRADSLNVILNGSHNNNNNVDTTSARSSNSSCQFGVGVGNLLQNHQQSSGNYSQNNNNIRAYSPSRNIVTTPVLSLRRQSSNALQQHQHATATTSDSLVHNNKNNNSSSCYSRDDNNDHDHDHEGEEVFNRTPSDCCGDHHHQNEKNHQEDAGNNDDDDENEPAPVGGTKKKKIMVLRKKGSSNKLLRTPVLAAGSSSFKSSTTGVLTTTVSKVVDSQEQQQNPPNQISTIHVLTAPPSHHQQQGNDESVTATATTTMSNNTRGSSNNKDLLTRRLSTESSPSTVPIGVITGRQRRESMGSGYNNNHSNQSKRGSSGGVTPTTISTAHMSREDDDDHDNGSSTTNNNNNHLQIPNNSFG